ACVTQLLVWATVETRFVPSSFFLSFGFSHLDDEKGDSSAVGVSFLVDSSVTSPLVEEGKRRRLYRWLCSTKDDDDFSPSLTQWLSSAIRKCLSRNEGKRRSVYWRFSETQINAADGNMDGSRHSGWLSETKINGVCCSGSGDGWMKTHDPGSPDQRRTLVDR
ncbi:hypothetical protein HID58_072362, partial [Brassica napus]